MANHPNRSKIEKIRSRRREYQKIRGLNTGVIRGAVDTTELQNEINRLIKSLSPRQRAELDAKPF